MSKSTAHLTIDINDVLSAGSVEAAIHAWCERDRETSSGVIGPEFSTSGPGPGWSKTHDSHDFASRALDGSYGALYYVDAEDGRMAQLDDDGKIEWTEESVVRLECPSVEDALQSPGETAEMAEAVIQYHSPESDMAEWAQLIRAVRAAAEALEDIDLDVLE